MASDHSLHRTISLAWTMTLLLVLSPQAWANDEYQEGFLTSYLNRGISRLMPPDTTSADAKMQYGRHITQYVSAPQFGGYAVGKYEIGRAHV